MTEAEILALYDTDKPAFILAVADLRERRTKVAQVRKGPPYLFGPGAEHYAAEGNPDHVLAAVGRWKKTAERHTGSRQSLGDLQVDMCDYDHQPSPCPDLTETADEARVYYLSGAA